MRTKLVTRVGACLGVLSLLGASACSVTTPAAAPDPTTACMISAPAGFEDHSAGALTLAETELARSAGVFTATSSQRVSDVSATSAALARTPGEECTLTTVVGPGGAKELDSYARENPEALFLGVASGRENLPDNVLSIDFDLVPPAFIAGYIAATASESGEVAAFVSRGFPQAEEILSAFDAGVALYNEEADEETADVTSFRDSRIAARTVDDTEEGGREFFDSANRADADVIVPFGSAAAMGVLGAADETRTAAATATPDPAGDGEPPVLPKLIWYGASGGFSEAVVATIEPNIRRGLRTMFPEWPQSKNPDEIVEPGDVEPAEMNGILVAERRYEGTIDNGGIGISAEDGFLSRVSDAGRSITDLRERIKSGDIDPTQE